MADSLPSSIILRKELREYSQACERLLSSTTIPAPAPLSEFERQMVEYYVEELNAHLIGSKSCATPCSFAR